MDEREIFIRHFREIQPKFSRLYTRILVGADLTFPQYALLVQLVQGGILSMSELSGKLGITKPAVTKLVDRLEKNRFLQRKAHPSDRRVTLIQIQSKGEKVTRETQSQVLRLLLKTLDPFSAAEKKTISRFYASLSQRIEETLTKR